MEPAEGEHPADIARRLDKLAELAELNLIKPEEIILMKFCAMCSDKELRQKICKLEDQSWGSAKDCIRRYEMARGMEAGKLHSISGGDRGAKRGRSRDRNKEEKRKRTCWECNKETDHFADSCPKRKSGGSLNGPRTLRGAQRAGTGTGEGTHSLTGHAPTATGRKKP